MAGATLAATLTGVVPEPMVDDCGQAWADAVGQAVAAEGATVLDGDDDDSVEPADDDDDSAGTVNLDGDEEGCGCAVGAADGGSGLLALLAVGLLRRRARR